MALRLPALALVGLLGLLLLACSDDAPPPRGVADEGYLALLCANLDRFSDAIQVETDEAGIADVIEAFIEDLEGVQPPEDLREYHQSFIDYLREALDDPTSPLVRAPPLPAEEARERLAAKERSVAECREPTFFSATPADQ